MNLDNPLYCLWCQEWGPSEYWLKSDYFERVGKPEKITWVAYCKGILGDFRLFQTAVVLCMLHVCGGMLLCLYILWKKQVTTTDITVISGELL